MAAIESIFGGAIAGAMYHLFCGQPLTIIGSTGPILVFETIMADYCKEKAEKILGVIIFESYFNFKTFKKDNDLEYLEFRWWVGAWTGILCIIIVVTDGSFLVQDRDSIICLVQLFSRNRSMELISVYHTLHRRIVCNTYFTYFHC